MSINIWRYDDDRFKTDRPMVHDLESFYVEVRHAMFCVFCKTPLNLLRDTRPDSSMLRRYPTPEWINEVFGGSGVLGDGRTSGGTAPTYPRSPRAGGCHSEALFEETVRVCAVCGWWIAFRETLGTEGAETCVFSYGGVGALKLLDLADVGTPIEDVRAYLAARYESRFGLHPRIYEETVASVFRDLGYRARVTAYSGDDGVDVILDGPGNTIIGVQVKRYRKSIEVAQIRELTGALVINGLTKGIFVTTSGFQAGAERTTSLSAAHGVCIELYDADRFYSALELAQRAQYAEADQAMPFDARPLRLIFERRGHRHSSLF